MNSIISFSPAILGVVVVLQAGLNKKIASQWGLSTAVLVNAVVFAFIAVVVFGLNIWRSDLFSESIRESFSLKTFSWWYLIPGMLGCVLVFGGPWAIAKWGAVHTFIVIISAQLLASFLWDLYVEGMPLSYMRLVGIGVAWVGAVLVCNS